MSGIPDVPILTGYKNASGTWFGSGVGGGWISSDVSAPGAEQTNLAINSLIAASKETDTKKRADMISNSFIFQQQAMKAIKRSTDDAAKALVATITPGLESSYKAVQVYKKQTLGAPIETAAPYTVLTREEVTGAINAVVNYINTKSVGLFEANTDKDKENALRIVRTIVLRDMMRAPGESGRPGSQDIKAIIETLAIKKYFLYANLSELAWKATIAQIWKQDAQEKNRNDVFNSLRSLIDSQYKKLFEVPVVKALPSSRTTSVEYADNVKIPPTSDEEPRYIKLHELFADITTTGPTIINYYAGMYPKLFASAAAATVIAPPPPARIVDADIVKDAVFKFSGGEVRITYIKDEVVYGLIYTSTSGIEAYKLKKDALLDIANSKPWIKTNPTDAADIKSRVKYRVDINTTSADFNVNKGATITLVATTAPELPNIPEFKFTWESADPTIATVVNDGVVTGVDGGDVQISAEIDVLGLRESVTVIVSDSASAGPPPLGAGGGGPPLGGGGDPAPLLATDVPITDANKGVLIGHLQKNMFFKNNTNNIIHIAADSNLFSGEIDIEYYNAATNKFSKTTFSEERFVKMLRDGMYKTSTRDVSVLPNPMTWQVGGRRKTRSRKMNRRRKTGKRSKPSRPSQSSSQQLF